VEEQKTNSQRWEASEQSKRKVVRQGDGKIDAERIGTGVDLLTGGFPCQPFSQAGKRKGTSDDRYLWPEMLRVIRLTKPTWVIAENVSGILTIEQGMVFEQVCLDLEGEGYEVQPFIIPAVSVNAPHRRDRVWFVAHSKNIGNKRRPEEVCEADGRQDGELRTESNGANSDAPDTRCELRVEGNSEGMEADTTERTTSTVSAQQGNGVDWDKNWIEVATKLCGVDDGLPAELDFAGWTKSRHRIERLKSLGNSIVPEVVLQIMRGLTNNATI
jgi:DNA (cytosine-5)-methyltransferase 1